MGPGWWGAKVGESDQNSLAYIYSGLNNIVRKALLEIKNLYPGKSELL